MGCSYLLLPPCVVLSVLTVAQLYDAAMADPYGALARPCSLEKRWRGLQLVLLWSHSNTRQGGAKQ